MLYGSIPRIPWAVARSKNILSPPTGGAVLFNPRNISGPPTATTSEVKSKSKRYWHHHGVLKTLNPQRIQSEDFIDISKHEMARVWVGSHRAKFYYGFENTWSRLPFPAHARGFLYHHRDPKLPPTTAQIRFRLTPHNDPAQFHVGQDMLTTRGAPWAINLLSMTKPFYKAFKLQLLEEGLLDPDFMRTVQEAWAGRRQVVGLPSIHYLEQPFVMDLAGSDTLRINTVDAVGYVRIFRLFKEDRNEKRVGPYSGRILVRFEHSTEPEHAGTRSLVIRVLEILEPIQPVIPGYDMYIPIPEEGQLLKKKYHGGADRIYSIDLDRLTKQMKDLALFLT
ncbi:hypothetical protein FPV67DRAFT_784005 [Lyophyllum atratum]|nr:hypothetical protein FPV67DRAFT_784005 [Lyophyllum atratum]